MITIRYSKNNSTVQHWKEKLQELVVAHQFVEDLAIENPILKDKEVVVVEGEEDIKNFIQELEKDIHDWRKPGCGV